MWHERAENVAKRPFFWYLQPFETIIQQNWSTIRFMVFTFALKNELS